MGVKTGGPSTGDDPCTIESLLKADVGVRDLADPAYPVLARSLRVRRENVRKTIAMLENLQAPKASTLATAEQEVA